MSLKRIVTIGGGTGSFTVLSGLKDLAYIEISAIVSMADDGGSTGRLRDEYGVLPPGDIRQCLVALSDAGLELRKLFSYRFSGGTLHGQNLGNIIISGAEKAGGSFAKGLELVHKILRVKGKVVPCTLASVKLLVTLGNGKKIIGEHNTEEFFMLSRYGVKNIEFVKKAKANSDAVRAIMSADLIVIGPGSLYTSVVPNLVPDGIKSALAKTKAKKVLIVNLLNKFGETDDFTVRDHLEQMEKYAGENIFNYVLYNTKLPPRALLEKYKEEGEPVLMGDGSLKLGDRKTKFVGLDLLAGKLQKPRKIFKNADLLPRTLIRHDPDKLAKAILSLI